MFKNDSLSTQLEKLGYKPIKQNQKTQPILYCTCHTKEKIDWRQLVTTLEQFGELGPRMLKEGKVCIIVRTDKLVNVNTVAARIREHQANKKVVSLRVSSFMGHK